VAVPSIDLHAHILPGVDDGPADLEGSLALARAAVAAGTAELAATPHVNERRFIEPEAIGPAVRALAAELAGAGVPLRLHTGAEVSLLRIPDLTQEQLAGLALGGGNCVLLESPFGAPAASFEPLIREVLGRGHRVLLAHPERCQAFQREPAGTFGSRVRAFTLQLLRDGHAHVVASDAHDHLRRPPGVLPLIAAAEPELPGLARRATWLAETVPAALLADAPVPEPPPLPAPKGWRRARGRLGNRARPGWSSDQAGR
jgi:protein-tyrosine phosphatase